MKIISPPLPTALYGARVFDGEHRLLILTAVIIHDEGKDSVLARAVGKDINMGKLSTLCYAIAIIPLAFFA